MNRRKNGVDVFYFILWKLVLKENEQKRQNTLFFCFLIKKIMNDFVYKFNHY